MSSTFGNNLKLSIFGQSHGPAIGMTLDGIPAGLAVDVEALQQFLNRRAPGNNAWSTPRKEADTPEFLGGILDGYTCGAPIAAVIRNTNTVSSDYARLRDCPRPGHADYTAQVKYGGFQDSAGGGHFSGRLTAPLCIAGGLCKQWLWEMGITISAHVATIGGVHDRAYTPLAPEVNNVLPDFPVLDPDAGCRMKELIANLREQGDSAGGTVECAVTGLPAGIGEPMFDGIENRIAQIMFGIPAVKGIDFGNTDSASFFAGSTNNDGYTIEDGAVKTLSNNCGGILGGISNGMSILFRVKFKPTPSISLPQSSISLSEGKDVSMALSGRHDPCIVPRAVPVVEAAAAIALFDLILGNTQANRKK